jgi:transposase InsO family protein
MEIESGEIGQCEASRLYGIPRGSLHKWLKKYGKISNHRQVVEIVMKDEKEKIAELQAALADEHLKTRLYEKMLELASAEYKTDLKKKFLFPSIRELKRQGEKVKRLSRLVGLSRAAYYKYWLRLRQKNHRARAAVAAVEKIRQEQPRVGTRKIHQDINDALKGSMGTIGRNSLHELLRARGMHVVRKKAQHRTTYSNHTYVVAPNRIKDLVVCRANQVLVSDITYIATRTGFAYLFLTSDLYSRKILGYHLSRDLSHHSALLALSMALSSIPNPFGVIHHSDRGCQYCCHDFLAVLRFYGILSSMTAENHCYENAHAERINGILKHELNLDAIFQDFKAARAAVSKTISIYNDKRRHWSLNLQTPSAFYCAAA